MFRNMKLGQKIAFGFTCLVVIAVVLGVISVWTMKISSKGAGMLAKEYVPSVSLLNNIERSILLTMYEIRGYANTENQANLDTGRTHIENVKKYLAEAKSLSEKANDLKEMNQKVNEAIEYFTEYETLLNEAEDNINNMKNLRAKMNSSMETYMGICCGYIGTTNDLKKAKSFANIAYSINNIRVSTWKAQAERNPEIIKSELPLFDEIDKKLDEVQQLSKSTEDSEKIDSCRNSGKEYKAALITLLDCWSKNLELQKKRQISAEKIQNLSKDVSLNGIEQTLGIAKKADSSLSFSSIIMVLGSLISAFAGTLLAIIIIRSITKPINKIISGLTDGSNQVAAASNQVSSSSQQLAEGASEQASSLEEVSSSLEEMTSMTKQNTENAKQADIVAKEAQKAAQKGAEAMIRMSEAINRIKSSSDETAKIIKTIDEIAFQTNLLALNAAVEAARAGEAGMGFAVVADEVRNLAQRSAEAAKNTATLIEGAQSNADNGVAVSKEVEIILSEIAESARKVTQLVSEVSSASDEQSQGITQLNNALGQMDKVTQASAASAEESASASEELSSQAAELQGIVKILVDMVGKNGHNGNGRLIGSKRPKLAAITHNKIKSGETMVGKTPTKALTSRTKPNDIINLKI